MIIVIPLGKYQMINVASLIKLQQNCSISTII